MDSGKTTTRIVDAAKFLHPSSNGRMRDRLSRHGEFKSLRVYQNFHFEPQLYGVSTIMVRCEKCRVRHEGTYGSGRFCSPKCSRAFSTLHKREEINRKVSTTLKSRGDYLSAETRKHIGQQASETKLRQLLECDFDSLSIDSKKRRVVLEQEGRCLRCGTSEWMDEPLRLQVDHEDGDTSNNCRENLRGLCPNCHSQTSTYCGRKRNLGGNKIARVTDERLLAALLRNTSISAALREVGYSRQRPHLERCKKLLRNHNAA